MKDNDCYNDQIEAEIKKLLLIEGVSDTYDA
jgi:hypothetical protein